MRRAWGCCMDGHEAEQLYQRHAPAIEAHCTQLLGSRADASDAVHETFVRVLARREALASGEHAVRSLFRISTHVCIDVLRQQRVRRRALPELTTRARESESHAADDGALEWVTKLVDNCDDLSRSILAMHYIEGRKRTEIADALGTSRRTVYGRLKRLTQLATELALQPEG